ncbi:MAG: prolyl oligopeptidase family serine peptidase [Candidatus Acidiferrales bacterium]
MKSFRDDLRNCPQLRCNETPPIFRPAARSTLFTFPGWTLLFVALLATLIAAPGSFAKGDKCPPVTRKDDTVDVLHGVSVADPYRWLEDQESAETRAWITAEDKCTEAALGQLADRAAISKRLSELMKVDSIGLPTERNGEYFFAERHPDQDLYVIYKRHGLDGTDEVLVDPHTLSADHSTSVGLRDVSRDGSLAAYAIRAGGQDEVTIHFIDTKTLKELPEQLPSAVYFGLSIEPDKRGVYYSRTTKDGPRVFHHAMGTPVESDPIIFGDGYGHDKIVSSELSEDGRFLVIQVAFGSGITRMELYVEDLKAGGGIKPVANDTDALFVGEAAGGKIFVQTNWNAPKGRVFAVDPAHLARSEWKEIVPESDTPIEGVRYLGGKVVVQYVRNATSQLKVFGADGKPEGEIALPALGSVVGLSGEWSEKQLFLDFGSYNIPYSVYRYNVDERKLNVWAAPKVPMKSDDYAVEQVWYASKDGTKVPMFLFYKKGMPHDGARPAILTGYGGFNVNETPSFSVEAVEWADAGGIFAEANLRGGGEFGEAWHHAGMMGNKQTVFDDFIAASEWLIANGYTNPKKLAIEGASNGGLLVGAALTQRPDLYQAVICAYPLLDMLRYDLFEDGPYWVPEYGSAKDAAQFKYLLAYSPYQNVKEGVKYPAVLFITGDGDTRVAPLHARKMAARLQGATASERPILLLYDTKSGHSGGRPLGKQIEEDTNALSFLFWQLGISTN